MDTKNIRLMLHEIDNISQNVLKHSGVLTHIYAYGMGCV